jgi:hypothetical protein
LKKIILLAAMSVAVHATPLTVFNTGVSASNVVLPAGSVDPHYTSTSTVFVLGTINAAWLPNTSTSKWVGPDATDGTFTNGGNYALTYRTMVDLTGFIASTAVITGRWATDNNGLNILLNGASKGLTSSTFNAYSNFTLNSGFVSGLNTIDFSWSNVGGPGGLRVEFLTADASSAIPEPASIALMLSGVAALAFFRRK